MQFLLAIAVIFAAVVSTTNAKATLFATGPNVIRLDAEETMMLVLLGRNNPLSVTVYLQDFPKRERTYSSKTLTIHQYKPQEVIMKVKSSEMVDNEAVKIGTSRYLYLVVKSNDGNYKFQKESVVLVQPSSGYVFIQTDKPIYSPRQTVNIRVIPVDNTMKPTKLPIRMDILNPQDIIVSRKYFTYQTKFISYSHLVVDRPMFGNWTIRASYGKNNESHSSVQFEVREYVLPVFEVVIKTNKFVLPETRSLKGIVSARYHHGKPVKGFVVLHYSAEFNGKITKLGNLQKDMEDGDTEYEVDIDGLMQPLGLDGFADGARLILDADVTERATFHTEKKSDKTCLFVRSPYVLSLARSSKYFKPSLVYDVRIDGREVNGQPSSNLPVKVSVIEKQGTDKKRTSIETINLNEAGRGVVKFSLLTSVNKLVIKVESNDPLFPNNQATVVSTAEAYSSPTNSFVIVRATPEVGVVGENINLEFLKPEKTNSSPLTIIITSRGRIVYSKTLHRDGGFVNTDSVVVTQDMVPSIRVTGFYVTGDEIVADSIWIDVLDQCQSEVTISSDKAIYEPDTEGIITLQGEPNTLVGLTMVDAAVYLLNDRHLLTRSKVFKTLEDFDLGCGVGGGANNADVFLQSGLSVISSTSLVTKLRESTDCKSTEHKRHKRAADKPVSKRKLHEKLCMAEGAKVLDGSLCFEMAKQLINASSRCRDAFLRGCRRAALCRENSPLCPTSARAAGGYDVDLINMFDIPEDIDALTARTNFKESTLFENHLIGPDGSKQLVVSMPSSITKWMIQGVTLSPTSGLCIAKPYNLTSFKPMYLDVRLPFKAIRGEQLEVVVTMYNFQEVTSNIVLYMYGVKDVCSEAPPGKRTRAQRFRLESNGAVSTSFPIIPLKAGIFRIKVVAHSFLGGDLVIKELYVVPEGKRITKEVSFTLDPQNVLKDEGGRRKRQVAQIGQQTKPVNVEIPKENLVPGTESCSASAVGNIMGPTIQVAVSGAEDMLRVPQGCGEQTMIRMAPTVYATDFVTQTAPDTKNFEKKSTDLIKKGYERQLQFRKPDGSFTVWSTRPSSTWLTAFVLKVFCQAREFIEVDANVITTGLQWLTKSQQPEGSFKEVYKVHHQEMIGNVKEAVSLTAFVLVTLRECYAGKEGLAPGEQKAVDFLEGELENIGSAYTLSITAYALALADSGMKNRAMDLLLAKSVYKKELALRYWQVGNPNSALAVEATSYALLALLELGDIDKTYAIANWLNEKRNSKGAFVSTQDTVVGLQAMTKFALKTYREDLEMECALSSEADVKFQEVIKLEQADNVVQKTVDKVPVNGKLIVQVKGSGVGVFNVKWAYNLKTDKDELCRFEMAVECTDVEIPEEEKLCDVCGQNCKEEEEGDYDYEFILPEARSAGSKDQINAKTRRRSRLGRAAVARFKDPGSMADQKKPRFGANKKAVCITVKASSLTGNDTGMSIIDVGLLTGFEAQEDDLRQMKQDDIIDEYEFLEERVILYLRKIPKRDPFGEPLTVKFRAVQQDKVGNIQPASVRVYDYYDPEVISCSKFYRPDKKSGVYAKLCENGKCRCAEGHCPKCYTDREKEKDLKRSDLMRLACQINDYVYEIKVTKVEQDSESASILQTKITVDLRQIVKPGGDLDVEVGESIEFFMLENCECPKLVVGQIYIVMGKDGPLVGVEQRMRYRLDDTTFVMQYYDRLDRTEKMVNRRLGNALFSLVRGLTQQLCPTK